MSRSPHEAVHAWMDLFMHRSWHGWSRFARAAGLSMPQIGILMQLHHRGRCGISDLSERFDITSAAASQLVDKLVLSGYLARTEDPSDRRARVLKLTPKGLSLVEQGTRERHHWMDDLLRSLSPEKRARVTEALTILTEAAQRRESGG